MFLNGAYMWLTKSWICRVASTSPDVLKYTIFITTSDDVSNQMQAWRPGLHTFVQPYPVDRPVSYGTLEYFQMILERLKVQHKLLASGANINLIESDTLWNSPDIIPFMREKFKNYDITSADDTGKGFLCPGFMGLKATATVTDVYGRLVQQYAEKLAGYHVPWTHYIGDSGGEQPMMLKLIKESGIQVSWLTQCEYANGLWYKGGPHRNPACQTPMVIHNNYIIGNSKKMDRAKQFGHWFLDEAGNCKS